MSAGAGSTPHSAMPIMSLWYEQKLSGTLLPSAKSAKQPLQAVLPT